MSQNKKREVEQPKIMLEEEIRGSTSKSGELVVQGAEDLFVESIPNYSFQMQNNQISDKLALVIPCKDAQQKEMLSMIENANAVQYSQENAIEALSLKYILQFIQKSIDVGMSRFNLQGQEEKTTKIKAKFYKIKEIASVAEQEWADIYTDIQNDYESLSKLSLQYDNFVNAYGASDKLKWNQFITKVQRDKLEESIQKKPENLKKMAEIIHTLNQVIQDLHIGSVNDISKADILSEQKDDQMNQLSALEDEMEIKNKEREILLQQKIDQDVENQSHEMEKANRNSDLIYQKNRLDNLEAKKVKEEELLNTLKDKVIQKNIADHDAYLGDMNCMRILEQELNDEIKKLIYLKNQLQSMYSQYMIASHEKVDQVRPSHFVYMLDESTSMTWKDTFLIGTNGWELSKQYFKEFQKQALSLGEKNIISVLKFSHQSKVILSKETILDFTKKDDILGECGGGGTNFAPVLRSAMEIAQQEQEHNTVFILLTDGQCSDFEAAKQQVEKLKYMNPSAQSMLFVIGVGKGVLDSQLKRLAHTANKSDGLSIGQNIIKYYQYIDRSKKQNWNEIFMQMTCAPQAHIQHLALDIENLDKLINERTKLKQEQFTMQSSNTVQKQDKLQDIKDAFKKSQIEPLEKSLANLVSQVDDERKSYKTDQDGLNKLRTVITACKAKDAQLTNNIDSNKKTLELKEVQKTGLNISLLKLSEDIIATYEENREHWTKNTEELAKKEAYMIKFACQNMNSTIMEAKSFYYIIMNRIDVILKCEANLIHLVQDLAMDQLKMEFLEQFSTNECRYTSKDIIDDFEPEILITDNQSSNSQYSTLDKLEAITNWYDVKHLSLFANRYWLVQMFKKQLGADKDMEKMLNDLFTSCTFDMIFQDLNQGSAAEAAVETKIKSSVKSRYSYSVVIMKSQLQLLMRDITQFTQEKVEATELLIQVEQLLEADVDKVLKLIKIKASKKGECEINRANKKIVKMQNQIKKIESIQQQDEAKVYKLQEKLDKVKEKGDDDAIETVEDQLKEVQEAQVEKLEEQEEKLDEFEDTIVDQNVLIDNLNKKDAVDKLEKKIEKHQALIEKYTSTIDEKEVALKIQRQDLRSLTAKFEFKTNQIDSDVSHITVIFAQLRSEGNSNLERAQNKFYKQFIKTISTNTKDINRLTQGFVQPSMQKDAIEKVSIKHKLGMQKLTN